MVLKTWHQSYEAGLIVLSGVYNWIHNTSWKGQGVDDGEVWHVALQAAGAIYNWWQSTECCWQWRWSGLSLCLLSLCVWHCQLNVIYSVVSVQTYCVYYCGLVSLITGQCSECYVSLVVVSVIGWHSRKQQHHVARWWQQQQRKFYFWYCTNTKCCQCHNQMNV